MGKKLKSIRGLFTNDELLAKMIRFEWLIKFEKTRKQVNAEIIGIYEQQQRVIETAMKESPEGTALLEEWVTAGRKVPKDEPAMVHPKKVKIKNPKNDSFGYFHGNDYH